jgi:hypothetical protein
VETIKEIHAVPVEHFLILGPQFAYWFELTELLSHFRDLAVGLAFPIRNERLRFG